MKLLSFRVTKFRNIVDSGVVAVDDMVTCLVGKNEAGKSGLIEALYLFNPAYSDGFKVEDQYPRWLTVDDRKRGDLKLHCPIEVILRLEDADIKAVNDILGEGAIGPQDIWVARRYGQGTVWTIKTDEEKVVAKLLTHFTGSLSKALNKAKKLAEIEEFLARGPSEDDQGISAEDIEAAKTEIRDLGLSEGVFDAAYKILLPRLPKFFRFTAYSTLDGRIDLAKLAEGDDDGPGRSSMQTARALLALAGTDAEQLAEDDYELRRGEMEAVSIGLSNQVFEYWKQNPNLEVLIDVDKKEVRKNNQPSVVARFLDIRMRDKRTGFSNNFSQRSSGFQWFFSFLAAFSEFDEQAFPIVLLDEPALTLHGKAQADFLRFINERLANSTPVIYTTHSPFMVETDRLERVRIVEDHGPPTGSTVTQDVLVSDADSLFPLQAALGYDIAQSLFIGPNNLVVEGTSDFIYLTVMSIRAAASGRIVLDPKWRILPAGGASNIPTFVSLIGRHMDITVLADSDTQGMQRVTSMIDKKLLKASRLVLANAVASVKFADIEDLFSEDDYIQLYNKAFGKRLTKAQLGPGDRIVKKIEAKLGDFDHGQVAEALLRNQATIKLSDESLDNFSKLNEILNATLGT